MQQIQGIKEALSILCLNEVVVFPSILVTIYLDNNDETSLAALAYSAKHDNLLVISPEIITADNTAKSVDGRNIYSLVSVVRVIEQDDGRIRVLLQGLHRCKLRGLSPLREGGGHKAKVTVIKESGAHFTSEAKKIAAAIRSAVASLVDAGALSEELLVAIDDSPSVGALADILLSNFSPNYKFSLTAFRTLPPIERLRMAHKNLLQQQKRFVVSQKIQEQTRDQLEKGQKEYFLREQLSQIKKELGESDEPFDDMAALKKTLAALELPEVVRTEVKTQLSRLARLSPESTDASLLRTYLEWVSELPWSAKTIDKLDLRHAKKVLNADHFGLDKVKDRILEYLSVRALNKDNKDSRGAILCLVGPPGVGKTSLGQSIARSLGRKFVRLSLGGVRDEAEIRGHRRTYVGALPGRIIQGLKTAGSRNPVFMLDEIDKVGTDFRGDPSSALLEVLDPEQNTNFEDHYLNVGFNLSEALFIATANTIDTIPEALLDRFELIFIPGYTTEEKLAIAKRYLIPRQLKACGLKKSEVRFNDKALNEIIVSYTEEAGVRGLEREIGALLRKLARRKLEHKRNVHLIHPKDVTRFLGPAKFEQDSTKIEDAVGRVTGLAWTVAGGETMELEASVAKGSGELTLTGQLGEVMQESARAAFFYSRANATALGIDSDFASKFDVHVHVPEGATPKDGPSAGIAIVVAIVSALSQRKVSKQFAMTGEVTLRGRVLSIGGLREKALAALRRGIRKIIIPKDNLKDLHEIPDDQRRKIQFIPVEHVSEVLRLVLFPKAVQLAKKTAKLSIQQPTRRT